MGNFVFKSASVHFKGIGEKRAVSMVAVAPAQQEMN